jgi:putative Ca2+/H+ antiporter (TMEM165/GDT1 family)
MCTGLAVVGGKALSSKISEKTVFTVGGVLFLIFAAHTIYVEVTGGADR